MISPNSPNPDLPPGETSPPPGLRAEGGVAGAIAGLTAAGLPLSAGLSAYSEEAPTWGIRTALRRISRALEAGAGLEQALQGTVRRGSVYLNGVVAAGVRTGRLAEVLERHLMVIRGTQEIRSRVRISLGYPCVLAAFSAVVLLIMLVWPVPMLKAIYAEFAIPVPWTTLALIDVSDAALVVVETWRATLTVLATVAVLIWAIRFLPGRPQRVRLFQYTPALGTAARNLALSEFCSLLSILVACDVPLPEALRLTRTSLRDPNLRDGARALAEQVERGLSAEDEARRLPNFPTSFAVLFRWSDRNSVFSEGLRSAGELYAAQARVEAGVVGVVLQPLLLAGIVLTAGFVAFSAFHPVITLLQALT